MTKRGKSYNDIMTQSDRLFHVALWVQHNSNRARKITRISKRYLANITNSNWGKSMFAKKDSLIKAGYKDAAIELGESGANVKHERELYMMGTKSESSIDNK